MSRLEVVHSDQMAPEHNIQILLNVLFQPRL
jgi:hypothetical protein